MNITKYSTASLEFPAEMHGASLIVSASYEDRCLVVPRIVQAKHSDAIVFSVADLCPTIEENRKEIEKSLCNVTAVNTDLSNPIASASAIDKAVESILSEACRKDVLVDITTFTHEHLLFLLRSLYLRKDRIKSLRCLYVGAKDYSYTEKEDTKWLSKGCKDVRSVIGFPGMVVPGETNVLIILAGFEHERAKCLIDEMDADKIYLGLGNPDSITDENHRQPLSIFNGITERALASYSDVFRFDFRACEPSEVLLKMKEIIDATPTANHIVVPMNTKLSTLAVAALGLQDSKVQICYSQPDTYNFTGYSQTGDDVTLVDCSDFLLV